MAHTNDDTVVADFLFNLINTNKVTLGLNEVYYGNQTMIPVANAAVITPGGKSRVLSGVQGPGGQTTNTLNVIIAVHRSKVGVEDTERHAVDNIATAVERLVHQDVTCGGIIIHGMIDDVSRGESPLANGSMFRSVVMSFSGETKLSLIPPP
ncbi:MAG TPA: hypothetical protein V6C65_19275 [Allocoleopsis sp.]